MPKDNIFDKARQFGGNILSNNIIKADYAYLAGSIQRDLPKWQDQFIKSQGLISLGSCGKKDIVYTLNYNKLHIADAIINIDEILPLKRKKIRLDWLGQVSLPQLTIYLPIYAIYEYKINICRPKDNVIFKLVIYNDPAHPADIDSAKAGQIKHYWRQMALLASAGFTNINIEHPIALNWLNKVDQLTINNNQAILPDNINRARRGILRQSGGRIKPPRVNELAISADNVELKNIAQFRGIRSLGLYKIKNINKPLQESPDENAIKCRNIKLCNFAAFSSLRNIIGPSVEKLIIHNCDISGFISESINYGNISYLAIFSGVIDINVEDLSNNIYNLILMMPSLKVAHIYVDAVKSDYQDLWDIITHVSGNVGCLQGLEKSQGNDRAVSLACVSLQELINKQISFIRGIQAIINRAKSLELISFTLFPGIKGFISNIIDMNKWCADYGREDAIVLTKKGTKPDLALPDIDCCSSCPSTNQYYKNEYIA